jgi:hypothetical protein
MRILYCYAELHYAKCGYAESRIFKFIISDIVMLSVTFFIVRLSVIMLSSTLLIVAFYYYAEYRGVAQWYQCY